MVRKSSQSDEIKRRLRVMMKERIGEPELPDSISKPGDRTA